MDQTRLYLYNFKTQQSKEWKHLGSPRPKQFLEQISTEKVITSAFWDKDGNVFMDHLEDDNTQSSSLFITV